MREFLVPVSWGGCDDRVHTPKGQGLPRSERCTVIGHYYFCRWKADSEKVWELLVVTRLLRETPGSPDISTDCAFSLFPLFIPDLSLPTTIMFSEFLPALLPFCSGPSALCALFTLFIVKHTSVMVVSVASLPPWPRQNRCAPVSGGLTFSAGVVTEITWGGWCLDRVPTLPLNETTRMCHRNTAAKMSSDYKCLWKWWLIFLQRKWITQYAADAGH